MATIWHVVFFSLVGGLFALVGGVALLFSVGRTAKFARFATPFAAGALLAAAFLDLLREAITEGSAAAALYGTLFGILIFFVLERFLQWFHHHHEHEDRKVDPAVPLIIFGDTIHNLIDGVAIGTAFLLNVPTGIIVSLAVAAHEIPQEIGDFGLLLKKGLRRKAVLEWNALSALASTGGAVLAFMAGHSAEPRLDIALGLVAGFFIYIAVSDIIPSIHKNEEKVIAGPQTLMLLLGTLVVGILTSYLHGLVG